MGKSGIFFVALIYTFTCGPTIQKIAKICLYTVFFCDGDDIRMKKQKTLTFFLN